MENNRFYKEMIWIKREKEMSIREFAKLCGVSNGTLQTFFRQDKPFRPLNDKTMSKINHNLGIPFSMMEEYNEKVYEMRRKNGN